MLDTCVYKKLLLETIEWVIQHGNVYAKHHHLEQEDKKHSTSSFYTYVYF